MPKIKHKGITLGSWLFYVFLCKILKHWSPFVDSRLFLVQLWYSIKLFVIFYINHCNYGYLQFVYSTFKVQGHRQLLFFWGGDFFSFGLFFSKKFEYFFILHLGLCYIITFYKSWKWLVPKPQTNRVQQQNWHLSKVWDSPLLCWYGGVHIRTVCESGTKIRSWYWQVCNMEVVMRVSYKDTRRKKIVTESLCE